MDGSVVLNDLFGPQTRSLEQMESDAIRAALRAHGTATEAAKQLKIGRATIHRKMRRYGININETCNNSPEAGAATD